MDLIYKVLPSKLFFPITAVPSVVALHSLWSLGFSFLCSIVFIDWSWDTLLSFKPSFVQLTQARGLLQPTLCTNDYFRNHLNHLRCPYSKLPLF